MPIKSVFAKDEMIDLIGVTKGKGFKGNYYFLLLNCIDLVTRICPECKFFIVKVDFYFSTFTLLSNDEENPYGFLYLINREIKPLAV